MANGRAFEDKTQEEQISLLEALGRVALTDFGVQPTSIEPLVHFENTTFKVESAQGTFNLRISRPGQQTDATIQSEIDFLRALKSEGFRVPDPYQNRVVKATSPGVPEARNVVLFGWMNGEFLRDRLTPAEAPLIGKAMAELHDFTLRWQPPAGFVRHQLHQWTFGPPEGHVIDGPVEGLPEADRELVNQIVVETCERVPTLTKDSETYGLIHADLHVGNLLIEDGQLNIIDFDDTGYAFLYYDFAAALAFHLHHPEFVEIRNGMLVGYESVRSLPPGTHELLTPFIRQRLGGVSEWILSRTDNPKLREIGPGLVHEFCEGMRRLATLGN